MAAAVRLAPGALRVDDRAVAVGRGCCTRSRGCCPWRRCRSRPRRRSSLTPSSWSTGGVAGLPVGKSAVRKWPSAVDEAEVVVHHVGVVHAGPEADRDAAVVQPGDLGLHRAGEVLVEVAVRRGRQQQVALVRVALRAGAEVARDHAPVVDAEQLVERHVVGVVNGLEAVGGAAWLALRVLALADPARATAPTPRRLDATVAAATRRAFLLMDFISVNPLLVAGTHRVVPLETQQMPGLGANLWGTGETREPPAPRGVTDRRAAAAGR